jgi:hypothetical protein
VAFDELRAGQQPQPQAQRAVVIGAGAGFAIRVDEAQCRHLL